MNRPRELNTEACLLIFDPHQDKEWMQAVIERERGEVSHLLLGGDYFDCFDYQRHVSSGEMAEYLFELKEEWGDRLTVLLGNHDIPYVEALPWSQHGSVSSRLIYDCPGWTHAKSVEVARFLKEEFWSACRLFQAVNGYLLSHAGVAASFWQMDCAPDEALSRLNASCEIASEYGYHQALGLLGAGAARGGSARVGGLTWQDWNREFQDELPLPQIVGHTPSRSEGARRKGRSWCIDGEKTCYGILKQDGTVQVKRL